MATDPQHFHDSSTPSIPKQLPRLTDNQKRCLRFIFQTFLETQEYPNQPEIALRAFGKRRRQYAHRLVEALLKKQCLARTSARTRNIELTDTGLRWLARDGIDVWALLRTMTTRREEGGPRG